MQDTRRKNSTLQIRLYLVGAVILLAGLASSALVYLTATDDRRDAIGYEIRGENVYVITTGDSKRYRNDLERIGGKAAVFADDFNRWFAGLWQGKQLATTLAVLAIGAALACFWAAHNLSNQASDDQDG